MKIVNELVLIDYTNWRFERRKRCIYPLSIRFGTSKWHPQPQWLLTATDMDDGGKQKEFAMSGIHSWENRSDA